MGRKRGDGESKKRAASRTRRGWGSLQLREGKYYLRYVGADGRRHMELAGTSLAAAEVFLATKRREVAAAKRGHSVRQLRLNEWWDEEYHAVLVSRLKPAGVRTATVHVQRLHVWLWTERERPLIRDVTRRDAEAFVAALIGEGLEPSYVRRLVSTIRRAWGDALVRGLAHENVWLRLRIAPPRPTQVPWVSPEQLAAIYAAVPESARPHLVLIGETGLRAGEAQALRRRDVEVAGELARVTVRDGKTNAARRTVPLTACARAVVEQLLAVDGRDEDLVLAPCTQHWLRKALAIGCAAAGAERLKVHGLRHVYASHLVQGGVPPSTVARLLGHADGGALVMRLYGRWMPHDAETRAVAGLTAWRARAEASAPPSLGAPTPRTPPA